MPMIQHISPAGWRPFVGTAMLAMLIALPSQAAGQVATIELVPVSAAGPSDTAVALPSPLGQADVGQLFVVEVWAQTTDSQGLSSVSATLQFDPAVAVVNTVTHTALFSELPSGTVDNVAGFVVGLSGSHLSTCADQVGVSPNWARVAVLDIQVTDFGSVVVVDSADTGVPALGTAICGVGDLSPAQVAYGSATLSVNGPITPTVSQWGLMVLVLLLLAAGTLVITRRMPAIENVI